MKVRAIFVLVLLCPWAAYGGKISGKVTNAQGVAVSKAAVTACSERESASLSTVTAADGSYTFADVKPGIYTVTVKAGQQMLRQEVSVQDESTPVRADFRLPVATAQGGSGLEERNPNIFIYRIDLNDLRNVLTNFRGPNPTYIPEFRAEQNYFGAEQGAALLAFQPPAPRPVLKAWHESVSAMHQNSALNARNFFNVGPLLPSRITNYDVAAGGPIISPKASLLVNFGQTYNSGMVNGNVQVPRVSERTPTATDPQARAIISHLLDAYPAQLPNLSSASLRQLNTNAPRSIVDTNGLIRMDIKPDDNGSVAGRYSIGNYSEDPFQLVIGQNPQTDVRSQAAYADVTRAFSPLTLGQFGFHFDRVGASLLPTRQFSNLLASLGVNTVPDILFSTGSSSQTELYNIGPGVQFPRMRVENRFKLYGNLSRTMGRHTVKFGWSATRSQVNDLQSNNSRGTLWFYPDFGRNAVQNFLLGTPELFTVAIGNLYRGFRNWEQAAFIEDEFHVFPTFSINMGVRYEAETSPKEVNHLGDPNMPSQNLLAPRFGLAWNPGRGRTTLRAGYGIVYSTIFPVTYAVTRFNPPAVEVLDVNAPNLVDSLNLAQAAPLLKPVPGARSDLYLLNPGLVTPYSHLYNLALEWALPGDTQLRVAYMGSRSFHLLMQGVYNRPVVVPGIPTTVATINERRPDPRYGAINQVDSVSIAYYDAAQVSVEKKLSRGLTFRAAYTFSKNINLGGDFTNTASGVESESGITSCDICNHAADLKGLAMFDTPQVFTFTYSYRLPFFGGSTAWYSAPLKRWQISGTTLLQSGLTYHLHTGGDAPGFGNVDGTSTDRPNILNPNLLGMSLDNPDTAPALLAADTCRAPGTDDIPYAHCKYFDTNIAPGGRGNLGMNTFRKDATANWNVAFGRGFPLPGGERSLDFRAEFINFFNTPQFEKPGVLVAASTFGKITNTVNKGRQIQFSLKLNF